MHEPGWYPDPEGTQGRFRWWDGQQWTDEFRDDPHSGLDAILDADASARPARPARILGYGTLSVALVAVVLGLSTAVGATFGRGPLAVPATATAAPTTATAVKESPSVTPRPTPAHTSTVTAAAPNPTPTTEQAAPPTEPPLPETQLTVAAPEEQANNCDGVAEDATRLSDGGMALQADDRWSRESVPSWLACGQGGRLLAGEGTAQLWVGRVPQAEGSLQDACAVLFDQTLMQVGTYRVLTHEGRAVTIAGREGYQVDATVGGGQEPTQRITLVMVNGSPTTPSVVVAVTDADDGEGMRATQLALGTLASPIG